MKLTEEHKAQLAEYKRALEQLGAPQVVMVALTQGELDEYGGVELPTSARLSVVDVRVMPLPEYAAEILGQGIRRFVALQLQQLGIGQGHSQVVQETDSEGNCMCAECQADRAIQDMLGKRP